MADKIIEHDDLKLYNADCIDIMKEYEDNYFDLAIVDPPCLVDENGTVKRKEYFNELTRVSKDQITWGPRNFTDLLYAYPQPIVWNKKSGNKYFIDGKIVYHSTEGTVRAFTYQWCDDFMNSKKGIEKIHKSQKTVELYNWILQNYSNKKYKILDTHLGSGSNAIANHYFGSVKFVGIELNKDYFNNSIKRIKRETAQMTLF